MAGLLGLDGSRAGGCEVHLVGRLAPQGFAVELLVFDNHHIDVSGEVAIAMGNYYFTCAKDGSQTKVEYTFGYKRNDDGKVRIFLHHSSVPYSAGPATVSSPIKNIKDISTIYRGDYIPAAAEGA